MNQNSPNFQLIQAIEAEDSLAVSTLLNNGASPNAEKKVFGIGFEPAISIAIRKKNRVILDLLLERGAQPEPFCTQLIAMQAKEECEQQQYQNSTALFVNLPTGNWAGYFQPSLLLDGQTPEYWITLWQQNHQISLLPRKKF